MKLLPFFPLDCWSEVFKNFSEGKFFLKFILLSKSHYEYIKNNESISGFKNMIFKLNQENSVSCFKMGIAKKYVFQLLIEGDNRYRKSFNFYPQVDEIDFFKHFPNIRSLTFRYKIHKDFLLLLLKHHSFSQIKEITFDKIVNHTLTNFKKENYLSFKKIRKFVLFSTSYVSKNFLLSNLLCFENLEHLHLSNKILINNFHGTDFSNLQTLKRLKFNSCNITKAGSLDNLFSNIPNIEHISLISMYTLNKYSRAGDKKFGNIKISKKFTKLRVLKIKNAIEPDDILNYCENVEILSIISQKEYKINSGIKFKNLTYLKIRDNLIKTHHQNLFENIRILDTDIKFTNSRLFQTNSFPKLKELTVYDIKSFRIPKKELNANNNVNFLNDFFFENKPDLQSISLTNTKLNSNCFMKVKESLKSLTIDQDVKIKEISDLPKLEYLYLFNCGSVHTIKNLNNLKYLKISFNSKLDGSMFFNMKNLENLTLKSCENISGENFKFLQRLQVLNIFENEYIKLEDLEHLKNLEYMDICRVKKITKFHVLRLIETLTNLNQIIYHYINVKKDLVGFEKKANQEITSIDYEERRKKKEKEELERKERIKKIKEEGKQEESNINKCILM